MATNFMTGRNSGRKIGRNFGRKFLGISCFIGCAERPAKIFSPNSSQFITPCLVTAPVTEISTFHLRELMGLKLPKGCSRSALESALGVLEIGDAPGRLVMFSKWQWVGSGNTHFFEFTFSLQEFCHSRRFLSLYFASMGILGPPNGLLNAHAGV